MHTACTPHVSLHVKVEAHYHRDPSAPASLLAPYRVLLDEASGNDKDVYVWAPLDADECIRAP
jgi:hypothetical protein|tara:strand:+ start:262 stop:450 length:189 start_codon:yes stop_codon:yes gene_type:complete